MADGVEIPINPVRNGYGLGAYGTDSQTNNIIISFNSNESLSTLSNISNNGSATSGLVDWFVWLKGLFNQDGSTVTLIENQSAETRRALTTWSGVFAPVALGIFSTMLFLRMGKYMYRLFISTFSVIVTYIELFYTQVLSAILYVIDRLIVWCLTPFSTVFQLCNGGQ